MVVAGSSEVEGVAGGELCGGGGLRVRSAIWAPVVSDRGWVAGQLRKDKGKLLVALVGRGRFWLRRIAPERIGG